MSVVNPESFDPSRTTDDVWNIVNTLPVNFQDFAEKSFYYGRMYDVVTGDMQGLKVSDFPVNDCVRESLWSKLWEVSTLTEARIGYNLSTQYHYVEVEFPVHGKGQTFWPGVSAFSVKPNWASIPEYGPFPIDPWLSTNAVVQNPTTQPIVEVPVELASNPNDVQFRNGTTLNAYTTLKLAGYPRRVGTNWEIAIDAKLSSFDPSAAVYLQHRKHLILEVTPPPTQPAGTVVHPVYPGTNQIIPQAVPPQTLQNGNIRYTFFIYALVDPAFRYETVDLEKRDHYKLYPEIEFKALSEIAAPPEVVWYRGGGEKTVEVTLKSVLNDDGIFHVVLDEEIVCNPCELWSEEFADCCKQMTPETVVLRYWYKTDPNKLEEIYQRQIPTLRQAIVHRVAAELPVADCGCKVTSGFIFENQQRFDDVKMNPYQGITIRSSKFTDTYGGLRYEALLHDLNVKQRVVMI